MIYTMKITVQGDNEERPITTNKPVEIYTGTITRIDATKTEVQAVATFFQSQIPQTLELLTK